MHEDVNDWKNKLSESEKKFLTNIFRFFTQGDIDVAGAYCAEYLPNFSKTPEIAMFLCSVAAREAIHIDAYSYLIETLGMPESTYREFLEYKEMSEKQQYLKQYQNQDYGQLGKKTYYIIMFIFSLFLNFYFIPNLFLNVCFMFFTIFYLTKKYFNTQGRIKAHIAAGIALFSGFTEGMQLFSSFTMLLSFPLNGMMKGMGQIITWSIVNETQHTDGMIKLFKIFLQENSQSCNCIKFLGCSCINKIKLEQTVYKIAKKKKWLI